ncbi:ion transporter [Luteibaculum oceani]|uniref:Ion transporter n=1 Tax=Luteibaculum oceani TaxID=1294296 RepID=A0A5C6UTA1_9FLAO|nr:ion transporter [Luteibaculum oceani]TXC76199.1 ion transporter [Luteibaculum oceani]
MSEQEGKSKFQRFIYIVIFGADTKLGKLFDIGLFIAILISVVVVMLESVSTISEKYHGVLYTIEWIITILFTLEYILRIWASEHKKKYIFSFFGLIDFFSILPTYLELFVSGAAAFAILRAVRLLRIFRVLKLVQFIGEASNLLRSLKASMNKITVFLSYVLISCTIIGATMYVIEGADSGFTSIPRSVYWAVVTLTTVGYGDISPVTPLGQFLAMILMILGYGVIAVPTGLVTADIVRQSQNQDARKLLRTCKGCATEIINPEAQYCHRCGKSLSDKK